jgi:hypothetical protein
MIQRIIAILLILLLITACGGAAATEAPATEPAATEAPATEAPAATEAPPTEAPAASPSPETPTSEPQEQKTPTPLPTQIISTPTDTPLPTLELPTEIVNAPARMVWDGAPTYLAESTPGFAFRVRYDPDLWALTADQFGFPALAHRVIPGCVISVSAGRGLPLNMTVEHDMLNIGEVTFDVGNVFENGTLKFVTYTGGDGTIITGFQVNFEEQVNECRAAAFAVISTLTSVPTSQATPTPTP